MIAAPCGQLAIAAALFRAVDALRVEVEGDPSGRERQRLLAVVCPPGSVCWLCGGARGPIVLGLRRGHPLGPSMDHVVPRSMGGSWDLSNLRPAHFGCNSARGARDPQQLDLSGAYRDAG